MQLGLMFLLGRTVMMPNALPASALAPLNMMALILVSVLRQPEFPMSMLTCEVLLTLLKNDSGIETMRVYGYEMMRNARLCKT